PGRDLAGLMPARLQHAARQRRRLQADQLRGVEVVGDRVEGELPCVALVGNVALEDGDAHRLALSAPVLEAARQGRDLAERRLLGEESTDLELRVATFLAPAEDIQQPPPA